MSLAPLMRIEMPESLFPPKRLKSLAFGGPQVRSMPGNQTFVVLIIIHFTCQVAVSAANVGPTRMEIEPYPPARCKNRAVQCDDSST
jgi:hypothetical protein